ncbi:MAG: Holliday junction resolvase RuvX [Acidimicrobiales bacterium]
MSDPTRSLPGRALGLDLGTRRIGIAVTDSAGTMALPRTTLVRSGDVAGDRRRVVELVLAEEATVVVVGLPLSLDGSRGPAARAAADEAEALRALLAEHGVDVQLFDERLTTVSAHQALAAGGARERDRRRTVDQAAAAVMLEAWLGAGGGRR